MFEAGTSLKVEMSGRGLKMGIPRRSTDILANWPRFRGLLGPKVPYRRPSATASTCSAVQIHAAGCCRTGEWE